MPQSEPVTILLVSEQADAIKLITISLRAVFSGCRVEVVYSADEARLWATMQEWAVILVDGTCLTEGQTTLIADLKRQIPHASVILQSAEIDANAALQAMQAGIDYFLSARSPAFLTELIFIVREALDKRSLRSQLHRTEERHRGLLGSMSDVLYELDATGRFLSVSSNVSRVLAYAPEELIGQPYQTVVPADQVAAALFRFNERRSGGRGTRRVELLLQKKQIGTAAPAPLHTEISACGLYDSRRRFLGTIGIIRDVSYRLEQDRTILQLQQQLANQTPLLAIAHRLTDLSRELQYPLSSVVDEARELMASIRDARLDDRLTSLTSHAEAATQLGNALLHVVQTSGAAPSVESLSSVLDEALTDSSAAGKPDDDVIREFPPHLPLPMGDRDQLVGLFRLLLNYAQAYLATVGRSSRLIISAGAIGPHGDPSDAPTLFTLAPPTTVEVAIFESDRPRSSEPSNRVPQTVDLLECYQRTLQLQGTLDVSAPTNGPFRIVTRLPVAAPPRFIEPATPEVAIEVPTSPTPAEPVPAQPAIAPTPAALGSQPERRRNPRVRTTLLAKVTLSSATWDGTMVDLSLGGACVVIPGELPAIRQQDAYVVLRTAASILELQGTAEERPATFPTKTPLTQLVLAFAPPQPHESAVLESLIDAVRESSMTFSLEVMLADKPERQRPVAPMPSPLEPDDQDRRESIRVGLKLPVRLDLTDPTDRAHRFPALISNLSRDGACVQVKGPAEMLHGLVTLHVSTTNILSQPGAYEPGAPDSVFSAEIIWSLLESGGPRELRPNGTESIIRAGLRFHALTPYAEREINRVIRQHLMSHAESEATSKQTTIVSVLRECRNSRGQAIAMADDHLRQPLTPNTPIVVIAPGFGQTAWDYTALAYYLAHHRLRVLRYDHTNHVGLSEGELQQTALRGMQGDLLKVVEFVQHTWPTAPLIVLASDMAARAALKMAAHARPLDLLLLVNPMIDVQLALKTAHGHDLVADYQYGLRRGIANLFSLNVNVDRFIGDVIAGRFTDLGSTLEDLRLLRSPMSLFTLPATGLDALPALDLPQSFLAALGSQARLIGLPTALTGQDLSDDSHLPPAFRHVLDQITAQLAVPAGPVELNTHSRQALRRQRSIETEHLRLRHNLSQVTKEALWAAYLQQLPQLGNLHEYWKLMDDLYRLLNPLEPGSIVVDVGVGHSDLARATMVNQAYRSRHRGWTMERPLRFLGVARSRGTLTAARFTFATLSRELDTDFAGNLTLNPSLTTAWIHADWMQSLPFKVGSLHRIVCNLSLPFVPSPLTTLRQLQRILHPQGRLVVTAFHHDTDLSVLYRRHLRQANQDEFAGPSQTVLHYLGRLREAIRHGLLHTFDRASLSLLLRQAGIAPTRLLTTLDGQALLVVVEKGNSSS